MATPCHDYDPAVIEPTWQAFWQSQKTFRAPTVSTRPKYYILDMFPYPSGAGLHLGHAEGYTASDMLARYRRAQGHNVLHPMGWDAFGLPAEQYAIKTGQHPRETTARNVDTFREQIKRIGFAIDWDREVNTTDPNYYRWTQWIFLQLFQRGLAYVDERPVWWCPALRAVLANEEVVDGRSEMGGHPVERRALRQWVLRITAYADRLLAGLPALDWPESTKTQQANWIGRSEGAQVFFAVDGTPDVAIEVYTTRPDTLFGATYMVLAPEHPLVEKLTIPAQAAAVQAYREQAARKSDLERTDLATGKEKTGVATGSYALNPVNGQRVPVWISDYVLASYGTGAIMAVPAHDERDYAFAVRFGLDIIPVVAPTNGETVPDGQAFTASGVAINSGDYTGLPTAEVKARITADLAARDQGRSSVNYKLRDWLFSRQRYWGEPFPIVWVDETNWQRLLAAGDTPLRSTQPTTPVTYTDRGQVWYAVSLPVGALPVTLPLTDNFQPAETGESPLANLHDWVDVALNTTTGETRPRAEVDPNALDWIPARRETNTMPQWAGSCWYYLRYCDPTGARAPISREAEAYWGAPDFYIGGAEHAVLHLLYARFWHLFLHDIGVVTTPEPFPKLFHQGLILGEDGEKMSKSRGNGASPDDVIATHGADAMRMYLMFMGPLEDSKPWNPKGIDGINRFLRRVWRLVVDREGVPNPRINDQPADAEDPSVRRALHETIRKVTDDLDRLRFNTAISAMMVFSNQLDKAPTYARSTIRDLVRLLAPFAPHLGEELWERLGGSPSVVDGGWPTFDPALLVQDTVKLIVQVNGKLRGDLQAAPDAPEADVVAAAQALASVIPFLEGKPLRKVIYVPGRILNLVV